MNDDELEAEMQALLQARHEKLAKSVHNNRNLDDHHNDEHDDHNDKSDSNVTTQKMYNKDGLLKCLEDIDNHLSFAESLVICNYQCDVIDENDDINREVSSSISI